MPLRRGSRFLILLLLVAPVLHAQTINGSPQQTISGFDAAGAAAAAQNASVQKAPSSGQLIVQPSATTLGVNSLNNVFYADGFPWGCNVGGVQYTTQADCAFYTAAAFTKANYLNSTVKFGTAYYSKCATWTEPSIALYTVSIEGAGIGASNIVQTCSTPTSPMIAKGEPASGGFGALTISGLRLIANNNANSCMDIWGFNLATFKDIDCTTVIEGSDHAYQFGERGQAQAGGGTTSTFDHLIASPPYSPQNAPARVTANLGSGATAGQITGYTVVSGGSSYSSTDLHVGIVGFGLGDHPCTTMPTATATVSGGAVTAVTPLNAGAGCTGTIDVQVYPASLTYGFDINASDSTFRDLYTEVGSTAGLNSVYGNNVFYHYHPTNIPVGVIDYQNNVYKDTECDTLSRYCIDFQGNSGTVVEGTNSYTVNSPDGAATYHFGPGAANVEFGMQGDLCTGHKPGDYHEFVASNGPIDTTGSLPPGVEVIGNDQKCGLGGNFSSQNFTFYAGLSALNTAFLNGGLSVGSTNNFKVDSFGNVSDVSLKAATGTRFLCVDSNGNIVSQSTACSGT